MNSAHSPRVDSDVTNRNRRRQKPAKRGSTSEQIMSTLPVRRRGPRGPRLDYKKMLKLLMQKNPILSYTEVAAECECSITSVSSFAKLPEKKREALASR